MKRLDYKLMNGKPFSVQYKNDYKGVVVVESKTKKLFATISADIHYTLSQMRFGFGNFPEGFGELDLEAKPTIFFSFQPTGSDLPNIMKAVKHFLIDTHGEETVFTDYKHNEKVDMVQFFKIFNTDEQIEEDVIEKKIQQAIQDEKMRQEKKAKQNQLAKFQSDYEKKYQSELKKFAKENDIRLPKEKVKGDKKLLWRMGS